MSHTHHPATRRPVSVHGLIIPADPVQQCAVQELALTAVTFSDAIGGGLLDEALTDDGGYTVYADADRVAKGLPPNPRATLLAARLGWIHLADRVGLLGDILIVGVDPSGNDADVPGIVTDPAHRSGILPANDGRGVVPQALR